MGDEGLEGLEARVDALHAPPLVAVGDLPPDPPLLVPLSLRGQWNVGKAAGKEMDTLRLGALCALPLVGPCLYNSSPGRLGGTDG